jgi:CubicO group peptidase (beta-lactamase class C family)
LREENGCRFFHAPAAVSVLQLVEQGVLSLDTPVHTIIDPVKKRHFLRRFNIKCDHFTKTGSEQT